MIYSLRWDYKLQEVRDDLVVGKEYWAYIAELNSKRTGLIRNVKPFKVTLVKHDNRYWINKGITDFCDYTTFDWNSSNCTKKLKHLNSDLYYIGKICSSEEECIESYNNFIHESVKQIKSRMKSKYNSEYIKSKTDNLIKNLIKV